MAAPSFIPGIELCRRFYWEAVRPVLDAEFPNLKHSAALIGYGSEVLGFDTEMSADHHWGPRVMLFLAPDDHARYHEALHETFRRRLPHRFLGYPTNFAEPDPEDKGTRLLQATDSGPVEHRVETYTIEGYVRDYLGIDLPAPRSLHPQMQTDGAHLNDRSTSEDAELRSVGGLAPADWLSIPQQRLRTFTGGAVYHDDLGLADVRARFDYYPKGVWLYLLASSWQRIGQEEHLMGRAGHAGDELGSRLIAARLVHDAMQLCFLMERQYAPYPKWFGTAFMRLHAGPELAPTLQRVLDAQTWQTRGDYLATATEYLAAKHNALGLTPPQRTTRAPFWSRPFPVIGGERFATALLAEITDPEVRRLTERPPTGGIDQISDNVDILENTSREVVRRLFE
jgi:hypothetical protein